jgi:hypothetical protein
MSIKSNAEVIRDETVKRANTAVRVGGNLVEIANDLILTTKFLEIDTYALLIALSTPLNLTIVKVLNDEDKGITNATYHLYPDGVRMWVASTIDI